MPACTRKINWRVTACLFVGVVFIFFLFLDYFNTNLSNSHYYKYHGITIYSGEISPHSISKKTVLQRVSTPTRNFASNSQFQDIAKDKKIYNSKDNEQLTQCIMLKDCFKFSNCVNGFRIYIYPIEFEYDRPMSSNYKTILTTVRASSYHTNNPDEACLFLLSLDTLDRDINSNMYIKDLDKRVSSLSHWNNGENHIIFILFPGKWPDYHNHQVFFNYGKAILLKSSATVRAYRQNYDISLPLFYKDMPYRITTSSPSLYNTVINTTNKVVQKLFPLRKKYLVSFKGKRYLYGVGSETRNALRVINNNEDIILLTTCRHGNNWEKYKDDDCENDNLNYDRFDYEELLSSSTFCLVPRGRRLGSFRLIESMKFGCIPIIASNGWVLPFSEVIDWSKFSVNIDEKHILRIPYILRDFTDEMILSFKQQILFVYEKYFSSMETNVYTALEILKERINPQLKKGYLVWNSHPGALHVSSDFSPSLMHYPFYVKTLSHYLVDTYTAIIMGMSKVYKPSAALFRLIKIINQSKKVDQILVVWLSSSDIPSVMKWPRTVVPLRILRPAKKDMNARYPNLDLIKTDAVFTLDEDVVVTSDELDFAFSVWKSNPSRLVGFITATHTADISTAISNGFQGDQVQWKYSSRISNDFSLISTTSAIYHKYYNYHYANVSPKAIIELVEREAASCESLAMNFLISHITQEAPIKVTQSTRFKAGKTIKNRLGKDGSRDSSSRQRCFEELTKIYSYIPLVHSKISANPVLYKDIVSIYRKKFRSIG